MAASTEKKPLNKTQLFSQIAEETGLNRQQVSDVFDSLANVIRAEVGEKDSVGTLTIPGLLKIVRVEKPAQPEKKGVPNPFKPGELMDVAAKPASSTIKLRPLKGLKDIV